MTFIGPILAAGAGLGGLLPVLPFALLATVAVGRARWFKVFGPVLLYDLVRTARRSRYVLIRCLYAGLVVVLLLWMYLIWAMDFRHRQPTPRDMAVFAESFFGMLVGFQFVAVVLLTPAYVGGAVAEEKERRTLEYLLATDLANREIVLSKLASRLINLAMLVVAGLPVLGFVQLMGGVDPNLVLTSFAATGLTLLSLGALSIFNSVNVKRARDAIVLTYLGTLAYFVLSFMSLVLLDRSLGIASWPSTDEWTSPVTVETLVGWFCAGNVFVQMSHVAEAMWRGGRLDQVLAEVLTKYAVFHGTVALACGTAAVLRLRSVALKQTYGKAARVPLLRRFIGRPPVGDLPMIWKEVFAEPGLRFHWGGRILLALLALASFTPAAWILAEHFSGAFFTGYVRPWDHLREEMNIWMRFVATTVGCLTLLGVAVRAAGSVSGERDRQTFETLLTTPLDSDAILFGKWLGSVLSLRWGLVWLGLIWLLGLATGGVSPFALPLWSAGWLVYAAFLAGLGLWFSTVSRTTLRANIYTLLVIVAAGFSHWLIYMCCIPLYLFGSPSGNFGRDLEWLLKFQAFSLTPPATLGFLAFRVDDFTHTSHNEGLELLVCCVIGLFIYAVAAGALWGSTSRRFRMVTGRSPTRAKRAPPASDRPRPRSPAEPPPQLKGAVLVSEERDADAADVLPAEDEPGNNPGGSRPPPGPSSD